MPLEPGRDRATFERNVREMIRSGHPQAQALAASYREAGEGLGTRPKLAYGGSQGAYGNIPMSVLMSDQDAGADFYHPGGFINSATAGRTDRLPMSVAADSHIIPADVVSGMGQGNSIAGAHILAAALRMGPYNTNLPSGARGSGPPRAPGLSAMQSYAAGGGAEKSPILAAGGEMVVPPQTVLYWGRVAKRAGKFTRYDDMKAGHEAIDVMIANVRKHVIKWLKHAPAPKK